MSGLGPNDLGEVPPCMHVTHIRFAAVSWIKFHLVVIELIRDHLGDLVWPTRESSSKVLTVSPAIDLPAEGVSIVAI